MAAEDAKSCFIDVPGTYSIPSSCRLALKYFWRCAIPFLSRTPSVLERFLTASYATHLFAGGFTKYPSRLRCSAIMLSSSLSDSFSCCMAIWINSSLSAFLETALTSRTCVINRVNSIARILLVAFVHFDETVCVDCVWEWRVVRRWTDSRYGAVWWSVHVIMHVKRFKTAVWFCSTVEMRPKFRSFFCAL